MNDKITEALNEIIKTAQEWRRPSIMNNVKVDDGGPGTPWVDPWGGDEYIGKSLAYDTTGGPVGIGDTPDEAMRDYDKKWGSDNDI
ncbi:MAG: hypothetical protein GY847_14505 [Proteobacteria bacterium]|nr:hypothetical protein [Pseudomonadota bacterium]